MENVNLEYTILKELLKEIRLERGVKQVDLSQRLGTPQSFVSKYESGERRVDLIELKRICGSLGVSLKEFVERFEIKLIESNKNETQS